MKTVRLRTKAGEVRFTSLAPFADLPSWWHETQFRGGVIGNSWCLPFEEIAVADLVDVQEPDQLPRDVVDRELKNREIARLAAGIGAGLWVPPGEKQ